MIKEYNILLKRRLAISIFINFIISDITWKDINEIQYYYLNYFNI